jgi:tRNA1(Val) A37 N6-methylase TrmN6
VIQYKINKSKYIKFIYKKRKKANIIIINVQKRKKKDLHMDEFLVERREIASGQKASSALLESNSDLIRNPYSIPSAFNS